MKNLPLILLLCINTVAFSQSVNCLLSKKTVVKNGILIYELTKTHNAERQLIETKERFLEEKPIKYTQTERFVYDNRGNAIEITMLLNEVFEKTTFSKFDVNNQLVEEAVISKEGSKATLTTTINGNTTKDFNSDGTFTSTVWESNANGKPTKEIDYDVNGKKRTVTDFIYDSENRLTNKTTTDFSRNRTTETTFKRGNKGSVLEETVSINAAPFSRKIYEVNSNEKVTKTTAFNRYNQPDYELTYTYNAEGNIESESYYHKSELITKKEYIYDENGNITKQDNFERGKLINSVNFEYTCF